MRDAQAPRQLAQLQRTLRKTITRPGGLREAPIAGVVRAQPPLSRLERLEIYRYAIFARFDHALADDFPAVRIFVERLKKGSFHELGREYRARHPSGHPNLSRFTHRFPEFVARKRGLLARFPFLADLARLEWATIEAFFSEIGPELDLGRIAGMPPERVTRSRVLLDPSVRLLASRWPIARIFHSERSQRVRKSWAVAYRGLDSLIYVEELSEAQFRLLSAFQRKLPLGRAAGLLEASDAGSVMEWFGEWARAGVIRGLG